MGKELLWVSQCLRFALQDKKSMFWTKEEHLSVATNSEFNSHV